MAARTLSGAWRRIYRRGKIQKRPVLRPVAALEQRAGRTARQQAAGRTALLAGASSRAWGARQNRSSARHARRRLQQHGRCGGAGGAGSSASEAEVLSSLRCVKNERCYFRSMSRGWCAAHNDATILRLLQQWRRLTLARQRPARMVRNGFGAQRQRAQRLRITAKIHVSTPPA